MKDLLSKTSGSLQGELANRDREIDKLTKRVAELEREITALQKQKEADSASFA
jgi:cell division protein FtsB